MKNIETDNQYYSQTEFVSWHEIDNKQLMRPIAFMNLAQEIANQQASALKFGYYELIAENQVWVLSRIKIKFFNPPKWGDKIKITTWHKGVQGLFGVRDFTLHKIASREENSTNTVELKEPELCAGATSLWVIINTETRRIERHNIFSLSNNAQEYKGNINAIDEKCDKLNTPSNAKMQEINNHLVTYSDIDFNHHANNAKYLEWIMNAIPQNFSIDKTVKSVQINYITEAKLNDYISITANTEAFENDFKKIYIEGKKNNAHGPIVFQAELEFM